MHRSNASVDVGAADSVVESDPPLPLALIVIVHRVEEHVVSTWMLTPSHSGDGAGSGQDFGQSEAALGALASRLTTRTSDRRWIAFTMTSEKRTGRTTITCEHGSVRSSLS